MGWWIANKKGGIDVTKRPKGAGAILNASKVDAETNRMWGDAPADIVDDAIEEVSAAFFRALGRYPTAEEVVIGFSFSLATVDAKIRKIRKSGPPPVRRKSPR